MKDESEPCGKMTIRDAIALDAMTAILNARCATHSLETVRNQRGVVVDEAFLWADEFIRKSNDTN